MAEMVLLRGEIAKVDDEDFPAISQRKWRKGRDGYAVSGLATTMHRLIMRAEPGQFVDHINHDRLDNRRENLRLATFTENRRNVPKFKSRTFTSKFKGVSWHKHSGKWVANIQIPETPRQKYLGLFVSEHEAAHAYNKAAIQYHGDFAVLNPIGIDKE